ncbi:3-oxoacyl-[acyl-carrier-protein] synthase I [Oryzomicrobium terrae]|uniref:3-oxoacyl-[acyl-carrier-protein] synthase I n=1 Tax=Oryzomicrobium terrae TaxID=1735038 RepID=A0A5C1E9E8_9RHOO|nr:beta-ketoacyl synthase N-terminal-like domain-containing protein [Oryzomicrobium terrae]QEL65284.1 3-oxoacyl-[acyl-carrier-protein] synthase I [Oryzomicrobium terrae]
MPASATSALSAAPASMAPAPLYIAGRGLVSSLGANLAEALATLAAGRPGATAHIALGEGSDAQVWPYRAIPDDPIDFSADFPVDSTRPADCTDPADPADVRDGDAAWYARARRLVRQAVAEAGPQGRDGPLFVASSSSNVGAVEGLAARPDTDCHEFAQRIAAWLDWRGPVFAVATACTSAMNALAAARDLLVNGPWASALVLGVELPNRFTLAGFAAMQLLSPDGARPFGAARNGLVLGEAVAALYLTRHATAATRWAVSGLAGVVDGSDPAGAVAPAIERAIDTALAEAGRKAADIGLIKVQAAGSPGNDAVEAAVLTERFAPLPPLVSLKAALGHTLGASGAAELALLTACLEAGVRPPRDWPIDPELAARGVALADGATPPATPPRHVLALILGFGGGHAALVLDQLDEQDERDERGDKEAAQ